MVDTKHHDFEFIRLHGQEFVFFFWSSFKLWRLFFFSKVLFYVQNDGAQSELQCELDISIFRQFDGLALALPNRKRTPFCQHFVAEIYNFRISRRLSRQKLLTNLRRFNGVHTRYGVQRTPRGFVDNRR